MEEREKLERAEYAAQQFEQVGRVKNIRPYGSGHINDTFLVEGERNFILQRMNRNIFSKPEEVMENILGVTTFLKKKIAEAGGDEQRETLTVIPARDQKAFFLTYDIFIHAALPSIINLYLIPVKNQTRTMLLTKKKTLPSDKQQQKQSLHFPACT